MAAADESTKLPHRRMGVWSSDTIKPKTPENNIFKRLLKADVKRISSIEEDDTISRDKRSMITEAVKSNVKSDLLKLPALNSWMKELNMGLLLKQLNNPEEIKEDDIPWNEDSLFAEITNELSKDDSKNQGISYL